MWWNYYENGYKEVFTLKDIRKLYQNDIDKTEYASFSDWLYDMEKMQILIKTNEY